MSALMKMGNVCYSTYWTLIEKETEQNNLWLCVVKSKIKYGETNNSYKFSDHKNSKAKILEQ